MESFENIGSKSILQKIPIDSREVKSANPLLLEDVERKDATSSSSAPPSSALSVVGHKDHVRSNLFPTSF